MQAIILNGPRQLALADVESPEADGDAVIIAVTACGICGSDLHYWELGAGMDGLPGLVMGHEFCGTVADPGSRGDLRQGERVVVLPTDACGACANCLSGCSNICLKALKRYNPGNNSPGAYAEYVAVRPGMVRKLPDSVNDMSAALVEPAAVALHAVNRAGVQIGDAVLITGGGPIGLLCAMWARVKGARCVILSEPNAFRIDFAKGLDIADYVLDATDPELKQQVRNLSRGGVHRAIETAASDAALKTAVSALKTRGRLVLAGISFQPQAAPTLAMTMKELDIAASFAYLPAEFDCVIDYLAGRRIAVEALVTSEIPLAAVPAAFEQLAGGASGDIKVLIRPGL